MLNSGFGNTKKGEETQASEPTFSPTLVREKYQKWFPELSSDVISKLLKHQDELVKISKVVSLIPSATLKNAEQVHFADSILASRLIYKSLAPGAPLYDFGSASGFPALVFATLYPDIKVNLVDRDTRKMEACKGIASAMGLSNVSFVLSSIEELPSGSVSNIVARGLSPLQRALLLCRKQVIKGGRFFHMKGDGWANELASVPSQLFSYWSPSLLGQYKLPESQTGMAVVLTDKIAD